MTGEHFALKFLRKERRPHVWCAGCGIGQVFNYTVKAVEELNLNPDEVVFVNGIGCSGRMGAYWIGDSMHTLHGRALAFATALKIANSRLKILVHMGDGDAAAIGGNHLIHTARRNVELTAVCINNFNYGMTGGQLSPTTPIGGRTTTSIRGSLEPPFNLCSLVASAGATFVARWTTAHARQAIASIKKAISHPGFSFIEIVSQCPTSYGRRNEIPNPALMMKWLLKQSTSSKDPDAGWREGRFSVGEFLEERRAGFVETLYSMAKGGDAAG